MDIFIDGKYNCFYLFSDYLDFKYLLLACVIGFGFFVYHYRNLVRHILFDIGTVLFVLGAGYNSIVRLQGKCVKDYFNFFGFFAFNLADLLVITGLIFVCWVVYHYSHGTSKH